MVVEGVGDVREIVPVCKGVVLEVLQVLNSWIRGARRKIVSLISLYAT